MSICSRSCCLEAVHLLQVTIHLLQATVWMSSATRPNSSQAHRPSVHSDLQPVSDLHQISLNSLLSVKVTSLCALPANLTVVVLWNLTFWLLNRGICLLLPVSSAIGKLSCCSHQHFGLRELFHHCSMLRAPSFSHLHGDQCFVWFLVLR